ncbi:MAG: ABC transporter ATP-binding protein [Salibacteraceae bacterium]
MMDSITAAISVQGVSKKFELGKVSASSLRDQMVQVFSKWFSAREKSKKNEFWALRDINFSIKRGEVVGIIGKNGAGKSTLLKVLSRITSPTQGQIEINGRLASLLEVGTGFHPELTGRENIFLNGAILGMKKKEVHERFDEIVEFAGVSQFLDTPVKRYSSGMYVRLAFAVAAHLQPDILIVDEVLAVGDAEFQKRCLGKMNEVASTGRTVIFVSHNMGAIVELCNRVILLENGRCTFDGNTNEAVSRYLSGEKAKGRFDLSDFPNLDKKEETVVLKCTMINDQQVPTSSFTIDEKIGFQIEYRLVEYAANARISIVLHRNGVPIFTTFSTDQSVNLKTGHHQIEFFCSEMSLKSGNYQAEIYISPPVFKAPEAVNFSVTEVTVNTFDLGYREDRQGLVIAQGKWSYN